MKDYFNKKFIILFLSITIIIISLFIFSYIHLGIESNNYKYKITDNSLLHKLDKIVIIGDSRMWLIDRSRDKLNIPDNIIFDAESGARINWLYEKGLLKLYKIMKDMDKNYKYNVVFNLGVNDLDSDSEAIKLAEDYFNTYKKIIVNNKNISFYILSVNPIDEITLYEKFDKESKRTSKRIEEFNNYFVKRLEKENLKNAKYCDSYNNLKFVMPDGLHYNLDTDKRIISYIIGNCVE